MRASLRRLGVGAAALAGLAALFWLLRPAAPSGAAREGSPAPALSLPDISGQVVSLSQYRGQVVLLDFWATWCVTCVEELPQLKRIHAAYRGRGFELLAASLDEGGRRVLLSFVAEHEVPWRVLLADAVSAQAYGVLGLPTKCLIDRRGVVARRYVGWVDPAVLEREIRALLEEKGDYSGPPPTEPTPSPWGRASGIRPPYGGANFQLGGLRVVTGKDA